MKSGLNIYEFSDYRHYLQEMYNQMSSSDTKYSYRFFSRLFGAKTPNYLKRIVNGTRNLSTQGIRNVAVALELKDQEFLYFYFLVLRDQSRDLDERRLLTVQLHQLKNASNIK